MFIFLKSPRKEYLSLVATLYATIRTTFDHSIAKNIEPVNSWKELSKRRINCNATTIKKLNPAIHVEADSGNSISMFCKRSL